MVARRRRRSCARCRRAAGSSSGSRCSRRSARLMPGGKRIASALSPPPSAVDQGSKASMTSLECAAAAIEAVDAGGIRRPRSNRRSRKRIAVAGMSIAEFIPTSAQVSLLLDEQQVGRVAEDAVVADHQRRGMSVAQMPAEAEGRVVPVARDAEISERAAARCAPPWSETRDLQVVHRDREADRSERRRDRALRVLVAARGRRRSSAFIACSVFEASARRRAPGGTCPGWRRASACTKACARLDAHRRRCRTRRCSRAGARRPASTGPRSRRRAWAGSARPGRPAPRARSPRCRCRACRACPSRRCAPG